MLKGHKIISSVVLLVSFLLSIALNVYINSAASNANAQSYKANQNIKQHSLSSQNNDLAYEENENGNEEKTDINLLAIELPFLESSLIETSAPVISETHLNFSIASAESIHLLLCNFRI